MGDPHILEERGSKMFKQTLKRMVLTAATVMVLMSTAASTAIAETAEYEEQPSQPSISDGGYQEMRLPVVIRHPWWQHRSYVAL